MKGKKTPMVTQLLVSNQKFTGENQVTRHRCRHPRHFCAGVGIPVNGQLLFCDVENHLIANSQNEFQSGVLSNVVFN